MQFSIKYRPTQFSEVAGQHVANRILANSILMGRVPNALVLFGLHGCGKTSLARIYAKALNCENFHGEPCCECPSCVSIQAGTYPGVIEYDAASHSGVADARDFEELLSYRSEAKKKVLILDECHMLTKQAQSVLLKLIEDPPDNSVFILVTTDLASLEPTVVSRCLKVDLRPIPVDDMRQNLSNVLNAEGHTFTQGFMDRFVQYSNGSLRDAQQLLESIVLRSEGTLDEALLEDTLDLIPTKLYQDLAGVLIKRDVKAFFNTIEGWYTSGVDLAHFFSDGVPRLLRDFMLVLSGADNITYYSGISRKALERNLSLTYEDVKSMLRQWEIHMDLMRDTPFPKIIWETYAVSICDV